MTAPASPDQAHRSPDTPGDGPVRLAATDRATRRSGATAAPSASAP